MNENKNITRNETSQSAQYAGRHLKQGPVKRKLQKTKKINPLFIAVIVLSIVLIALIVFLIVGPGEQNNALIGTWKYDQYTEYEFYDNGKGCLCVDDVHYEYEYKISGDKLELDFTEDIVRDCEYTFTVENNNLTLVGGEGTDQGTYSLNRVN